VDIGQVSLLAYAWLRGSRNNGTATAIATAVVSWLASKNTMRRTSTAAAGCIALVLATVPVQPDELGVGVIVAAQVLVSGPGPP
jgi:hypothetical protein